MFNSTDQNSEQKNFLQNIFTFDGRSLAAMRIATACLLILDTLGRWPYLESFYSDAGLLNREDSQKALSQIHGDYGEFLWSLLFISGELWWAQLTSAILILFSILLLFGFQTRIATIASWVLLVSFQHRNPLVLTSGDTVLKLILFWSIFIPWGKFWSLDRRFLLAKGGQEPVDPAAEFEVFSAGTFGFLCQFVMIYFFEGLSKANGLWWSGEAMESIVQFDTYARPWTSGLLSASFLLKSSSFLTLVLQVFFILFLLSPFGKPWWRTITFFLLAVFHILWISAGSIGLHHWAYLAALLFLVPGGIWESSLFSWIQPAWHSSSEGNLATVADEEVFRDYEGGRKILAFGFCSLLLATILGWHLSLQGDVALEKPSLSGPASEKSEQTEIAEPANDKHLFHLLSPKPTQWLLYSFAVHQEFNFLGTPPTHCQWLTFKGTLKNGNSIDLRHLQPVPQERPSHLATYEPSFYWRQLHLQLARPKLSFLRGKVASYLTDLWNRRNREDKQITHFVMVNHRHPVGKSSEIEHQIWYDSKSLSRQPASDSFLEILRNRNRPGNTHGL